MILVGFSGGLDSTAMLWHLLQTTDEEIHAHHVQLRDRAERWRGEDVAVSAIVPAIQRLVRPFSFAQTGPVAGRGGVDVVLVSRALGEFCRRTGFRPKLYCRGGAAHDELLLGIHERRRAAAEEWARWFPDGQAAPTVFPMQGWNRRELWGILPDEVRMMTASCRRPMKRGVYECCGTCPPCRGMRQQGITLERRIAV